jgi:hypothetical protein
MVFVIASLSHEVVGIVDVNVIGGTPLEKYVVGIHRELLQHTIPYPIGIFIIRVACSVKGSPSRHIVLVLLIDCHERSTIRCQEELMKVGVHVVCGVDAVDNVVGGI